jgi:hypothetical protein
VKTAAESFVWTESDRRREERARIEAERRAGELRVEIQKTADLILTAGEDCLASEALTNEERQLVINNRDRLVQALQNYDRLLEKTLSPFRRSDLSSVLSNALWAVTVLSRFAPPVDAIRRREQYHRAAHARRVRQEKPEEIALMGAIVALIERKVSHPTKEATAMRGEVNWRLTRAGFKKVSSDVIRRRLENIRALEDRI